jgi:hypothetical protein
MSRQWLANAMALEYCPHCYNAGGLSVVQAKTPGTNGLWPNPDTLATSVRFGMCGDEAGIANPLYNPYLPPDNYTLPQYNAGGTIDITIVVTAPHSGHYEFFLCPVQDLTDPATVTWTCLHKYQLIRVPIPGEKSTIDPAYPERYYADAMCDPAYNTTQTMRYRLPAGVTC